MESEFSGDFFCQSNEENSSNADGFVQNIFITITLFCRIQIRLSLKLINCGN